jgi:ATP-dependent exoDNAse (exonuclease V) alpha subunit
MTNASVTVDTFDGLFGYTENAQPSPYKLLDCAMVIIDEIGYLGKHRFEFAMRCNALAGNKCVFVLAGDFGQLESPGKDGPANSSSFWKKVLLCRLQHQHRADKKFMYLCNPLRLQIPTAAAREQLTGNRVFGVARSVEADIKEFFRKYPDGLLLAVSRSKVAELNKQVFDIYFRDLDQKPYDLLVRNGQNWDLQETRLGEGARVMINLNLNKKRGEVNGAMGCLHKMLRYSLVLDLDNGNRSAVSRRRPCRESKLRGFSVELAWACTIAKIQGRTLSAVAICPDVGVPAAAYSAITRVRSLLNLFWIELPGSNFFVTQKN